MSFTSAVLPGSISPLMPASRSDYTADAVHDARWAAWVERYRQHDLASTHKLRQSLLAAAAFVLLVAVAILSLAGAP